MPRLFKQQELDKTIKLEKNKKTAPTLFKYCCKYCTFAKKKLKYNGSPKLLSEKLKKLHENCEHGDNKFINDHCIHHKKGDPNKIKATDKIDVSNLPFFFADCFRDDEIHLNPEEEPLNKVTERKSKEKEESKSNIFVMKRREEDDKPLTNGIVREHLVEVNQVLSGLTNRKIVDFNPNMSIDEIIRFNNYLLDVARKELLKTEGIDIKPKRMGKLSELLKEFVSQSRNDDSDKEKVSNINDKEFDEFKRLVVRFLEGDFTNLELLKERFNRLIDHINKEYIENNNESINNQVYLNGLENERNQLLRNLDEQRQANINLQLEKSESEKHLQNFKMQLEYLQNKNKEQRDKRRSIGETEIDKDSKIKHLEEQIEELRGVISDMNRSEETLTLEDNRRKFQANKEELQGIIEELSLIILAKEDFRQLDQTKFNILKEIIGDNNINLMMEHAKDKKDLLSILDELRGYVNEKMNISTVILKRLKSYLIYLQENISWRNNKGDKENKAKLYLLIDIVENEISSNELFKEKIQRLISARLPMENQLDERKTKKNNFTLQHLPLDKKESELTFKNFSNRFVSKQESVKRNDFNPEPEIKRRELSVEPEKIEYTNKKINSRPVSSYDKYTNKEKEEINKDELFGDIGKMFYANSVALERQGFYQERERE